MRGLYNSELAAVGMDILTPIRIGHIEFQPFHCVVRSDDLNIADVMLNAEHIGYRGSRIGISEIITEKILNSGSEGRHLTEMVSKQDIAFCPLRK